MNQDRKKFYAARDLRTVQLGGESSALSQPVTVFIGLDVASSRPGQVAALALINMLSRVHRTLNLVVPIVPLIAVSLIEASDLPNALVQTALSIDPFISITTCDEFTSASPRTGISVGLGSQIPNDLDCYIGWVGGRGEIGNKPCVWSDSDTDLLGAATASCLAATAVFQLAHKRLLRPTLINLLERTADQKAGTSSLVGPVDVGSVHLLGAGAVAHALLYWLREFGVIGQWQIADGDSAMIHNTNRCLGMTAVDAGWPNGIQTTSGLNKAVIGARLIGANPHPTWYDESDLPNCPRPDLIIPLANERGVRAEIAALGMPLVLHATTSTNWTAELHRHIAGRDDCPACRIPPTAPQFICSTGPINLGIKTATSTESRENEPSSDAALPFLSATAGLMLAIALMELPNGTPLLGEPHNHWRLHLDLGHRLWQTSIWPGVNCHHLPSAKIRKYLLQNHPTRWAELDAATQSDADK